MAIHVTPPKYDLLAASEQEKRRGEQRRETDRIIEEINAFAWLKHGREEMADPLKDILTPATETAIRMKLLLFGGTGAGKTYSALKIATGIGGKIALLDPESGAKLYGTRFPHDVLPTDDIVQLEKAVRLLAQGGHEWRTLIIDPISLLWSAWIEQWENRFLAKNVGRSGHRGEWYEMGMKDWGPIKRTWSSFMRMLVNLDMNTIVCARQKAMYEGSGDNLRKVGETPDCEKSLEYWFDTVLQMRMTGAGARLATTKKDRTGKLPPTGPPWDFTTTAVVDAFSGGNLDRAVTTTLAPEEILDEIRELAISLDLSESKLSEGTRHYYGVAGVSELNPEQASAMLGLLKAKIENGKKV